MQFVQLRSKALNYLLVFFLLLVLVVPVQARMFQGSFDMEEFYVTLNISRDVPNTVDEYPHNMVLISAPAPNQFPVHVCFAILHSAILHPVFRQWKDNFREAYLIGFDGEPLEEFFSVNPNEPVPVQEKLLSAKYPSDCSPDLSPNLRIANETLTFLRRGASREIVVPPNPRSMRIAVEIRDNANALVRDADGTPLRKVVALDAPDAVPSNSNATACPELVSSVSFDAAKNTVSFSNCKDSPKPLVDVAGFALPVRFVPENPSSESSHSISLSAISNALTVEAKPAEDVSLSVPVSEGVFVSSAPVSVKTDKPEPLRVFLEFDAPLVQALKTVYPTKSAFEVFSENWAVTRDGKAQEKGKDFFLASNSIVFPDFSFDPDKTESVIEMALKLEKVPEQPDVRLRVSIQKDSFDKDSSFVVRIKAKGSA